MFKGLHNINNDNILWKQHNEEQSLTDLFSKSLNLGFHSKQMFDYFGSEHKPLYPVSQHNENKILSNLFSSEFGNFDNSLASNSRVLDNNFGNDFLNFRPEEQNKHF